MGDLVAAVAEWIANVVYSSGYVGVFVLVALGNLHLPVPTQLTLPLAGFLIGQGEFSFVPVMVWSSAAAVAVSLVFYLLGFCISEDGLRRFVARYGRFVFLDGSDLDKASEVFERHGGKAILIGHLVPGIGAFISIPAGMQRMKILGRFMFYTIVGCVLWNGVHVGLGWALGSHWRLVERYAAIIEYSVLAVTVAGIIWFVLRRWRARR